MFNDAEMQLVDKSDTPFAENKKLSFRYTCLSAMSWRGAPYSKETLALCIRNLAHPYKLVRESIAAIMASATIATFSPAQRASQVITASGLVAEMKKQPHVPWLQPMTEPVAWASELIKQGVSDLRSLRRQFEEKSLSATADDGSKVTVYTSDYGHAAKTSTAYIP